ncbi:MAG: caspase domain-containing protein [Hyphomicrobiales bacterium]
MRRVVRLSWLPCLLAMLLAGQPAGAAPGSMVPVSDVSAAAAPPVRLAQQYYYSPYSPYAPHYQPYQQPQPRVQRWRRAPPPRPEAPPRPAPQVRAPAPASQCEAPLVYSQGLKKCICVAEGHGLVDGRCVKLAEPCGETRRWSAAEKRCVCRAGHLAQGDECINTRLHAGPDGKPGEELLTSDIGLIQRCLAEAGYLKGTPGTSQNPAFWTAFWFFKTDHGVDASSKGVLDLKVQLRLFDLCPQAQRELGVYVASARPATPAAAGEGSTAQTRLFAAAEAQCLPPDLLARVTAAYGPRPALKRCLDTCLPVPEQLAPREVAAYEANRVVEWCKACLQIGSHLPLDDVLLIERETNVSLCSRPPTQLPRWSRGGQAARAAFTRVRELYRPLPSGTGHEKDFAVVIGNRTYRGGIEANGSAHNNANAVYALLTEHQGFATDRVIDLRDATLDDLKRVFGHDGKAGELAARLKGREDVRLIVYYAGHGATQADQSESYLLPVDASPHRAAQTGYALSEFYGRIAGLGVKSGLVILEAEFGRDISDIVFPPNIPAMRSRVLPKSSPEQIVVMAAATGDQRTLEDQRYGIGLFTRYLIEGMAGRADLAPIGNGDNAVDAVELYAYSAHMVRLAARKSFGLLQQPVVSEGANPEVSRRVAQGN